MSDTLPLDARIARLREDKTPKDCIATVGTWWEWQDEALALIAELQGELHEVEKLKCLKDETITKMRAIVGIWRSAAYGLHGEHCQKPECMKDIEEEIVKLRRRGIVKHAS